MFRSFIRALTLGSALYTTSASSQEGTPELMSSPEISEHLAPIADIFLETAQRDVVVLSQDDLFQNNAFMKRRMRIAQEMGVPFHSFLREQDYLPIIRSIKAKYSIGHDQMPQDMSSIEIFMDKALDTMLFERLYYNVAAASRIPIQGQDEDACLISAPITNSHASSILAALAHLPTRQLAEIDARITYEDIYQYIMLHEAAHCAQDFHEAAPPPENVEDYKIWEIETDIESNIHALDKETEADDIALSKMKDILTRDGRPEELANIISSAVKAGRAIGALRVGADLFSAPEQYPKHATHVFEGAAPFDYEGADVFLAVKTITTLVNLSIGYNYGTLASFSNNPALNTVNQNTNILDMIIAPEEATAAGFQVAHEYPEIQYGTMKAILELSQRPEIATIFSDTSEYIEKAFQLSQTMMGNYISAMDEYHPTIAHSRLAQDSYDQLMNLADNLDLNKENETPAREPTEMDPDDPYVLFTNSLEPPTNAQEALVLMRRIVDFYESYKIYLDVKMEQELNQDLKPKPPILAPRKP